MSFVRAGLVIGLLLIIAGAAQAAEVSRLLPVQGRLTDLTGNPEQGTFNFRFQIWDDDTGGAMLWEDTFTGIDVEDGFFQLSLGPLDLPFDRDYWLQVFVEKPPGTEQMFTSRQQILPGAYALSLGGAATALGSNETVSVVNITGTDIASLLLGTTSPAVEALIGLADAILVFANAGGFSFQGGDVGIGTLAPQALLHVGTAGAACTGTPDCSAIPDQPSCQNTQDVCTWSTAQNACVDFQNTCEDLTTQPTCEAVPGCGWATALRVDGDVIVNGNLQVTGTVANVVTVQTREQGLFLANVSGDGTAVTPLTIVMTPKRAGNKIILEWVVNGEMHWDTVYIVTRNGVLLANTTNVANNRWAGVVAHPGHSDVHTTPDNVVVKIIDMDSLDVETTYELRVRASAGTQRTLYLNRVVRSAGANADETSLSVGTAMEIWQ